MFTCPVCYFKNMPYPAQEYNICPCCGTEFENDDEYCSHTQLRANWIARGAKWFFRQPPPMWNPWQQLAAASVELPYSSKVTYFNALPGVVTPPPQAAPYRAMIAVNGHESFSYGVVPLTSTIVTTRFNGRPHAEALEGELVTSVLGLAA